MANKLYPLNKSVLSIKNNVEQFLNGLTSNTLDKPQNAFLTIHGKIVATFDQLKAGDDEYVIFIEKPFGQDVLQHLDKYIKLSKTEIEEKPWSVYFDLEGKYNPGEGEYVIPQKKGQLVITEKVVTPSVSEAEFTLFRLQNNIPVHGKDYTDDFILNVSAEDFVSFTKGCFLGQEPVSKVHSRSKPSWVLSVAAEGDYDASQVRGAMTSKADDPQTHKTLGFVFVSNNE